MPQFVKGAKWVFGWVIVGPAGELPIPPAAWDEYQFQVGDKVAFLPGSGRSGGFGLSHTRLLAGLPAQFRARALAWSRVDERGRVTATAESGVRPGDRLLVVRGSGRALGFLTRGPICDKAQEYPDLACFRPDAGP